MTDLPDPITAVGGGLPIWRLTRWSLCEAAHNVYRQDRPCPACGYSR